MNEFTEAVEVVDEGWDDIDLSDLTEETAADGETETEAPEVNQQTDEETENAETTDGDNQAEQGGETFTLKYLGAEKTVNKDEVITLAQKGMDYDRIRSKYDKDLGEANEKLKGYTADLEWLDALKPIAEGQGMEIGDFVMNIIATQNAAKNGTTISAELPKVKLDFERKSFEKQKAEWETSKGNGKTATEDEDIQAEIAEFQTAFPEAAENAKAIPKEVWDAKNAEPQKSLAQHYREYMSKQKDAEIANLKSQLAAAQQNAENKHRSTGSQSSAGGSQQGDIWDRLWAEN